MSVVLHLIKLFLTASMAMFVYFLDGIYIYICVCVCVFFARTLFGHVLNMCGSQNDERDILMHFECLNWCDVTVNRGDNVAYDMMG